MASAGACCRYATAGTQVVVILLTTSMTQRGVGWVTGWLLPAVQRRIGRPYTQEQLHDMHMNAGFHLGNAFAEVSLVTMQVRGPLLHLPSRTVPVPAWVPPDCNWQAHRKVFLGAARGLRGGQTAAGTQFDRPHARHGIAPDSLTRYQTGGAACCA